MTFKAICSNLLLLILSFSATAQLAPGRVGVLFPQTAAVAAFVHINSTYLQSPTLAGAVTTTTINAAAANIVIVTTNSFGASTTLTDNGGHTWTRIAAAQYAGSPGSQYTDVFYCVGSFSSALTVSTSNISYISVSAFSGAAASPVDVYGGGTAAAGATTTATSSVTPGFNGDLLITVAANGNVPAGFGAPTVSAGITIIGAVASNAGVAYNSGSGYQILASTAATSATWSYSGVNTTGAACTIVLFKHL